MPTLSSSTRTSTPRACARDQGVGECLARRVVAENIGGQGDGVLGARDGGQHLRDRRRRRLPASSSRLPSVSGLPVTRALTSNKWRILLRRVGQQSRRRAGGLGVAQPAHAQRPARHPVDAEHIIKQPAQDGREPGRRRSSPARRAHRFSSAAHPPSRWRPAAHTESPRQGPCSTGWNDMEHTSWRRSPVLAIIAAMRNLLETRSPGHQV